MNSNSKICVVLGTRPEIIKMAPVIRECEKRKLNCFVLHTGQHYDENMDKIFFKEMELSEPKYNLKVGSRPYRKQVGIMIKKITSILKKERPNAVIVQGDTISVLAGALAASKLGIKIVHHEAGLRSRDTSMLEEINRVIVDHVADFLMAPTKSAVLNLLQEGRERNKIFLTGNTIADAVNQNLKIVRKNTDILKKLGLKKGGYLLLTCHRAESVDKKEILENMLNGAALVSKRVKIPAVFPIHPRTKGNIKKFGVKLPKGLISIKPVGFIDFLSLEKNAKIILTDSGGVQEEACILKVPCVTLRKNTERPETLEAGSNILAGGDPKNILESSLAMLKKKKNWGNPFGSGRAAKTIIDIVLHG